MPVAEWRTLLKGLFWQGHMQQILYWDAQEERNQAHINSVEVLGAEYLLHIPPCFQTVLWKFLVILRKCCIQFTGKYLFSP